MKKNKINKITVIALIILIPLSYSPLPAMAIWGAGDTVIVTADTSFTSLERTVNSTKNTIKDYVLDTLAWSVANIMLQEITISVVTWINTGFQGNPSFLTNPQRFFMDIADSITGDFISETGILSGLCTPFNIDIRLAIALGPGPMRKKYACTLSTVIESVGNSTINGKSIKGFMDGDFSQGGWPAFITMTTEPQNNAVGAYLVAQSDLLQKIGVTEERYKNDLVMGGGFLSWQRCTDLPADDFTFQRDYDEVVMGMDYSAFNNSGNQKVNTGYDLYSGEEYSVQRKVDKNGKTTYKNCETETPGSVIGGAINKSLGIPQDRLNLASSFNQIVNALFAQLVTQVLSGGLKSASSPGVNGSSGGVAYQMSKLKQDQEIEKAKQGLKEAINSYYQVTNSYVQTRQQASDSIQNVRNQLLATKSCFNSKVGAGVSPTSLSQQQVSYARNKMAEIDTYIATNVDSVEKVYGPKLTEAKGRVSTVQQLLDSTNNATSTESLTAVSTQFSTALQGNNASTPGLTSQIDVNNAEEDLLIVNNLMAVAEKKATEFRQACDAFPASMIQ